MAFIYCLNTSTIRPVALLEKIRLAGRHGFAAVELWLDDVIEHIEAGGRLEELKAQLDQAGLQVPCTIALKGWGEAPKEQYSKVLDGVRRRMELAASLQAPFIVATPPREPAALAQIIDRYGDLLALGRRFGVRPAMEYLGFCRSVYRIDQAWQIVRDCGDERATIVVDAFHTFRGGSSIKDIESIPADRIANYHLDDAPALPPRDQQTDADRVMPGDGHLDLGGELAFLARKGYRGPISLELFNRTLWQQDPDDVLRTGIERMQALLEPNT